MFVFKNKEVIWRSGPEFRDDKHFFLAVRFIVV